MIPDDEPTVQPLFDDDVEEEKTVKKKTTTFDTPNNIHHLMKKPGHSIKAKIKNKVQKLRSLH